MKNSTQDYKITLEEIANLDSKWLIRGRQRIPEILTRRLKGETLQDIAERFGVTKERIRQLEAVGCEIVRFDRLNKV